MRTDLLDDTDEILPDRVAVLGVRHQVVLVQIRPADARAHDRISRRLDDPVGNRLDADITRAVHE